MAELTQQERLQPSLLDRLTDDEPLKQTESREQRILSLRKLRKSVMRDLMWLLNTDCLASSEDLSAYPEIQKSVLNFGIPGLVGKTGNDIDLLAMEENLKASITRFEPRILPNSIKIRSCGDETQMGANTLIFEVEGELWAQPMPERLYFRTVFDIELGNVDLRW
jgi:type VI secretion system protein ImpF